MHYIPLKRMRGKKERQVGLDIRARYTERCVLALGAIARIRVFISQKQRLTWKEEIENYRLTEYFNTSWQPEQGDVRSIRLSESGIMRHPTVWSLLPSHASHPTVCAEEDCFNIRSERQRRRRRPCFYHFIGLAMRYFSSSPPLLPWFYPQGWKTFARFVS